MRKRDVLDKKVLGSNIGGLLSAQYAENRLMVKIFEELLNIEGSELYMKPVENYVEVNTKMTFDTVIEALARDNSIVLGFRRIDPNTRKVELITAPKRKDEYVFREGDTFIVLSENPL